MDNPLPSNLVEQWQKFFSESKARITSAGCEPKYVDYKLFQTDLFPLQRRSELSEMLRLVKTTVKPQTIMEIGSDKGGLVYHYCLLPTVKRVIACEIRGIPYAELFEERFPHIKFLWLPLSSLAAIGNVRQWLSEQGASIDVLFVDGDKTLTAEDIQSYQDMVSRTGILFVHDITDAGPRESYRAAAGTRITLDLINTTDVLGVLGRPRNSYEGWLTQWAGRSAGIGCIFMPEYGKKEKFNISEILANCYRNHSAQI